MPIAIIAKHQTIAGQIALSLSTAWKPKYTVCKFVIWNDGGDEESIKQQLKSAYPEPSAIVIGGHLPDSVVEKFPVKMTIIKVPEGALMDPDKGMRWVAAFLKDNLDLHFPDEVDQENDEDDDDSDVVDGSWRLRKERKWTE